MTLNTIHGVESLISIYDRGNWFVYFMCSYVGWSKVGNRLWFGIWTFILAFPIIKYIHIRLLYQISLDPCYLGPYPLNPCNLIRSHAQMPILICTRHMHVCPSCLPSSSTFCTRTLVFHFFITYILRKGFLTCDIPILKYVFFILVEKVEWQPHHCQHVFHCI